MRWLKPNLRASIYGLLGHPAPPSDSRLENALEDLRESMLDLLGPTGPKQFPLVIRRIRYATDVQALWYLRGDLLAALAAMHGERAAREQVAEITARFKGLLPAGLHSRPSPLVD